MGTVLRCRVGLVWASVTLSVGGCSEPAGYSDFPLSSAPSSLAAAEWVVLATDVAGDGRRSGRGDGRSLAFYHDVEDDTLWFRWELYDGFDEARPAVSLSIDTDADQRTGRPWYGANADFRFDVVASVGPMERADSLVRGYNGLTDTTGVVTQDWMNRQSGGLTFYLDPTHRRYFLGIARSDLGLASSRLHVIGSVGSRARWNDDIGESGFATIDLEPAGAS